MVPDAKQSPFYNGVRNATTVPTVLYSTGIVEQLVPLVPRLYKTVYRRTIFYFVRDDSTKGTYFILLVLQPTPLVIHPSINRTTNGRMLID